MAIIANFEARRIHKQIFPATDTFRDDANHAVPDGWTNSSGPSAAASIQSIFHGHRKVMVLAADAGGDNAELFRNITSQTSGTIEFWMGANDVSFNTSFRLQEGSTLAVYIRLDAEEIQYGAAANKIDDATDFAMYHFRIDFECGAGAYEGLAADTFFVYVNGTRYGPFAFENAVASITRIDCLTNDAADYFGVIDAIGDAQNDASYKIGDNVFWRYLKDQDSDFESEDVGASGTDIDFIDVDDTVPAATNEIIALFDAHKKVMKLTSSGGVNDADVSNTLDSSHESGTVEWWMRSDDVSLQTQFRLQGGVGSAGALILLDQDKIQYYDGAFHDIVDPALDNTWYHFKLEFECGAGAFKGLAADTYYLWVDNVRYGPFDFWQALVNVNTVRCIVPSIGTYYGYFDAISYSWNNEIADNRTFDYLPYSYDDITSSLSKADVEDEAYFASTALLEAPLDILTITALHILQLYDLNSDLRFEGNFFKKTSSSGMDLFSFHSLNKSNLKKLSSYTATAEDPSEILLGVFTSVAQNDNNDSRLLYYEEDDPAGSHSPTIIRTPNVEIIRRMAYHADRYAVIKPNGVFMLDADRNPSNGAEVITASTGEIRGDPLIESFDSQINKVTVFGDFDLDTGIQFVGVSQDTTAQGDGTGIVEYSKTYKDLRSNADCLARATAIRTGTGFNPQVITTTLLNVYANMGEVINLAYVPKSFSATDCYAKKATHNLMSGISLYELSTGIFEDWGMSQEQWSIATEGERQNIDGIFVTDIITTDLPIFPGGAASYGWTGLQLNTNDYVNAYLYIDPNIDPTRDITIRFLLASNVGGGVLNDGELDVFRYPSDGSDNFVQIENGLNFDFTTTAALGFIDVSYTLAATDIVADTTIHFQWYNREASDAFCQGIQAIYFIKRVIT